MLPAAEGRGRGRHEDGKAHRKSSTRFTQEYKQIRSDLKVLCRIGGDASQITWTHLREELLRAERERNADQDESFTSENEEDKDKHLQPSAQVTSNNDLATFLSNTISTALATGFQRLQQQQGDDGWRGNQTRGRGGGRGGGVRGGGRGGGGGRFSGNCFCCGKPGHRAAECWQNSNNRQS